MPYIAFIAATFSAPVSDCYFLDTFTAADGTLVNDHSPDKAPTGYVYAWSSTPPGAEIIGDEMDYGDVPINDGYSGGELRHPDSTPFAVTPPYKVTLNGLYTEDRTDPRPLFAIASVDGYGGDGEFSLFMQSDEAVAIVSDTFWSGPVTVSAPAARDAYHTIELRFIDGQMQLVVDGVAGTAVAMASPPVTFNAVDVYLGVPGDKVNLVSICPCTDEIVDVPPGPSDPLFLDFEGSLVGDGPAPITTFYDTAPQDYGIVFSGGAAVLSDGGLLDPSSHGPTVLTQNGATSVLMTVAAGFVSPLEFDYVNNGCIVTIRDSGGTILASEPLFPTFDSWASGSILFSGTATTATFDGESLSFVIDGMTINPAP